MPADSSPIETPNWYEECSCGAVLAIRDRPENPALQFLATQAAAWRTDHRHEMKQGGDSTPVRAIGFNLPGNDDDYDDRHRG